MNGRTDRRTDRKTDGQTGANLNAPNYRHGGIKTFFLGGGEGAGGVGLE